MILLYLHFHLATYVLLHNNYLHYQNVLINLLGAFYGNKILKGTINPKTGEAWKLADVPKLWKAATEAYLAAHGGEPEGE